MDGPKSFPPYPDPIDVRRATTGWPVFLTQAIFLPVNKVKTEAKNSVVLPFLEKRIREMVADGFPLPADRLDEMIELASMIEISDFHETQMHDGHHDYASYRLDFFRILSEDEDVYHHDLPEKPRTLIHELVHVMAGHALPGEVDLDIDSRSVRTITESEKKQDQYIASLDDSQQNRLEVLVALNEASTETLARWIVSDQRPDFANMTCQEFFRGPTDVNHSAYLEETVFCINALGDMPLAPLMSSMFSNYTSLDIPGQRINSHLKFYEELGKHIKGGMTGLAHLWELDQQIPLIRKLPEDWLSPKLLRKRAVSFGRKKANDYFDSMKKMTDGWSQEQTEFQGRNGSCEIAQPNTVRARLVIELPAIHPDAKGKRDETIARAREIYPLRVRTPNTPGAADPNQIAGEKSAPESPPLTIND